MCGISGIVGVSTEVGQPVVERMVSAIKQAVSDNPSSSVLAFLPGQAEIRRTNEALSDWVR